MVKISKVVVNCVTSHFLKNKNIACMIPIPVMQLFNLLYSTLNDNVNILKKKPSN